MRNEVSAFVLGAVVGGGALGLLVYEPQLSAAASQLETVRSEMARADDTAAAVVSDYCQRRTDLNGRMLLLDPRTPTEAMDVRAFAGSELTLCGWYWRTPHDLPPWDATR